MALGLIPNSFSFTINLGLFISLNQKRQKYKSIDLSLVQDSSTSKLLTFGGQIIIYWSFPDGASGKKNPPANAGDPRDVGSIPGSGRSLGIGSGTHSNILAWKIPWAEEPGGLISPWGCESRTQLSEHTVIYLLGVGELSCAFY